MAVTFSASGSPSAGGVQQTYALEHDALLEGQLSDIRNNTIITRNKTVGPADLHGDNNCFRIHDNWPASTDIFGTKNCNDTNWPTPIPMDHRAK